MLVKSWEKLFSSPFCRYLFIYLYFGMNAGLEKVWDVKPLVNGKDIMSVLQLKAGGPLIREWVSCSFSFFFGSGWGGG